MKNHEIKKLALASLLCALACVIITIGCIIDIADLIASVFASFAVAFSVIELKGKYPYLVYAVTATLSILLFPSSAATLYFTLFFGYYPILKPKFERLPPLAATVSKYSVFNAAIVLLYFIMKKMLLTDEVQTVALTAALWITSNIFFTASDKILSLYTSVYLKHFRKKWGVDKFLK